MTLIDTSAWIEFLRVGGNANIEARVRQLLLTNQAAWCDIVQLELWNGAGSERDRKLLREFEIDVVNLETNEAVWTLSRDLARRARSKGVTVPAADILIAACAFHHEVEIETADNHFHLLAKIR